MLSKILAMAAGLMLLCSCSAVSLSGAESLLVAPKLNKRQTEISQALEATLSLRSIVYKYPQSGEYRSPFIFFDFDGDSRDEAIVFYSLASDTAGDVRAKILTQNDAGEWSQFYDITSRNSEVEFVQFEKLLDRQSYCMIIGWRGRSRQSSALEIYSMRDGVFKTEANASYLNYSIGDYDRDGLAEVVVIGREGSRGSFSASLLRGRGGHVETVQTLALCSEIEAVLTLTGGAWEDGGAIYIDEMLTGGATTIATEIIRVSSDNLTLLCGGEAVSREEPENPARSNYELTFRDDDFYCMDFNGDGIVEVPNPVPLPASSDISDDELPKLVQLRRLTADGFDIADSAVINRASGYLVYFPERWQDRVTVELSNESSEWRFRKWNPDTLEPAEELLRIRVLSTKDYLDNFEDYIDLATKGTISYTAYIPKIPGESLAVTEDEVRQIFKLLPS